MVKALLAAVIWNSGYLIGRTGGRRPIPAVRPVRAPDTTAVHLAEGGDEPTWPKLVTVALFVKGLRQINEIVAGTTGMPWRRFVAYTAIGAAAWVGVWATTGYAAGNHVRVIVPDLHRFQWYLLTATVLPALAYADVAWPGADSHR